MVEKTVLVEDVGYTCTEVNGIYHASCVVGIVVPALAAQRSLLQFNQLLSNSDWGPLVTMTKNVAGPMDTQLLLAQFAHETDSPAFMDARFKLLKKEMQELLSRHFSTVLVASTEGLLRQKANQVLLAVES